MPKVKKINRSASSGEFVSKETAKCNPNETVSESVNPSIIYHDELIEMLGKLVESNSGIVSQDESIWAEAEKLLEKVKL
jgi:hypothetical protein